MSLELNTPVGTIGVVVTARGVAEVCLTGPVRAEGVIDDAAEGTAEDAAAQEIAEKVRRQFDEYFAGTRREFDLPLDTDVIGENSFRARALKALMTVGYGNVITYGQLASLAGSPRAARAAGTACATNPLAILIPCHRVVPSSGGIGSYGGGQDMKRWLLQLEGGAPA